jgi:uncharacterized protein DUF6221
MTDLVEFLRARLTEDEQAARMARADFFTVGTLGMFASAGDACHVIRHDPARVLREVEAKRHVLERHGECGTGAGYCDDGGHDLGSLGCGDLLDLALPYADHPDYRDEWKP